MRMLTSKKAEIIGKFRKSAKDTGHPSVQIALLTERIRYISEHLKTNKKDHTTQVGLLRLVGQRRRLLDYLKRKDLPEYGKVIKQLGIRK